MGDNNTTEHTSFLAPVKKIYTEQYKKLLILPLGLLIIAILVILTQVALTGEFIQKDVSLKGGITITIPIDHDLDTALLEDQLAPQFPDLSIRKIRQTGSTVGLLIESSSSDAVAIVKALEPTVGALTPTQYSVETMGSSLGASFFRETLRAMYVSFLCMALVVYGYFGPSRKWKWIAGIVTLIVSSLMLFGNTSITKDIIGYGAGIALAFLYIKTSPTSTIIIFNVLSDLIITIGAINLLGMHLSSAGIAAFLMLIGYSVDTNILLSTKVLKSTTPGDRLTQIFNAMKTGLMMNATTLVAVIIAIIFTQSEVIRQIMMILLIGLVAGIINTWILNAGVLRWTMEKKA